jgi:hypothetical protein
MKNLFISVAASTLLLLGSISTGSAESYSDKWSFDVFLDGKKVGTHVFEVIDAGEQKEVQSVADFKVKFWLVNAYTYQHTNIEQWDDDCLLKFDAKTRVNGKRTAVSGESADSGFLVDKGETQQVLPACVMSFAYWNPEFLKQERLLNPQTGDFLDVGVELQGQEDFIVRGERVAAQRYKVTARGFDLMVWYSTDSEWLGLESVAKGGRIIRYELS